MPKALGVLQDATSENVDHDANQIHDTLIGKNSSQALRSAVNGQYRNVMDISQFVVFLYFRLLDVHVFSY